jgi:hypothetical protein
MYGPQMMPPGDEKTIANTHAFEREVRRLAAKVEGGK